MPLCPQITNTAIPVVLTADFTVTDVVPVLAADTEQLSTAVVGLAKVYYQTTAPISPPAINAGSLWFDTDDGNKEYSYQGGVWVSVQDGSIATAQSAANTALANAAAANAVGVAAQGTANTALANAAAANATGVAAQSTANTALANAATAFTAAVGSLQPSANTIVNASNQMTAINGTGITVFSGASSTTGARVVLNSLGLAGFNASNAATFSISATTGAAVFAGNITTGATITGGTMNIGGNAIIDASGFFTATGATITGTITTSNITVTGGTLTIGSTFAVTAGGVLTASGATITGTLTSNNITVTGGTLTIGANFSVTSAGVLTAVNGVFTGQITSTNATITGGSLTVGSTFSVTSAGVLTATSGTIGGFTLSASSIFSSTNLVIETSGQISGGNSATIFYGFANIGGGSATGERLIVAGNSAFNGSIAAINSSFVGQMNYSGVATGAGTAMVVVTTGSRVAIVTSSERFKDQIAYINTTGWLDKVMQMKPITYKTREDFTTPGEPNDTQIGFLAEDIYDIGGDLEKAVILDSLGKPFSLSYDRLTVFLTLAIKELKAEINTLKGV